MTRKRIRSEDLVERIMQDQAPELIETGELLNQLDEKKVMIEELLLYGHNPTLLDLSKTLIEKFRMEATSPAFNDDEEMERFYSFYKKELIAKYMSFLTIAANHLFDEKRLNKASVKDLSTSMSTVLDMLKSLMNKPDAKLVQHTGSIELRPVTTLEEANKRIEEAKAKLKAIDVSNEPDDPIKF